MITLVLTHMCIYGQNPAHICSCRQYSQSFIRLIADFHGLQTHTASCKQQTGPCTLHMHIYTYIHGELEAPAWPNLFCQVRWVVMVAECEYAKYQVAALTRFKCPQGKTNYYSSRAQIKVYLHLMWLSYWVADTEVRSWHHKFTPQCNTVRVDTMSCNFPIYDTSSNKPGPLDVQ